MNSMHRFNLNNFNNDMTNPLSMDRDTLRKFLNHFDKKTYPSKFNIFSPGDSANHMYYLIDGSMSIYTREDDGKELVLDYISSGEMVGEVGLFLPMEKRKVYLKTRTPSEVAKIEYSKLLSLFNNELKEECPKILYFFGEQISKRLLMASRKASSLAFADVTERIMRTLYELCRHPEAMTHPQGMQIKASRQELSKLSGCSREMAGRALKELEAQGKLTAHGKTIVVFGTR